MCGIVGIVTTSFLSEKEKTALKWMSYFDYVRGTHSTGYIWGKTNGASGFIKKKGAPEELWRDEIAAEYMDTDGVFKGSDYNFLVGHNRAATRGAITTKNAHPFLVNNIIGVHNGTVNYGLHHLPDSTSFEVDSEAIFNAISKGWTVEEIENALTLSYTFVWHDADNNTLNLVRNANRPLWLCMNKTKTTMLFASESWMIYGALSTIKESTTFETPFALPVHEQWTLDLSKKDFLANPTKTKINIKPFQSNHQSSNNTTNLRRRKKEDDDINYFGRNNGSNILWFEPRSTLSKRRFKSVSCSGCSYCSGSITYQDYLRGDVKFLFSEESPICMECVNSAGETQYGYF
jgi:asparagine synthetase B (glutamine-hydrolysing)